MKLAELQIKLIEIHHLKPHEKVFLEKVEIIQKLFHNNIYQLRPVVIDLKSKMIIDGHHRYEALKRSGCLLCPCIEIDYLQASIIALEGGASGKELNKNEIINSALNGFIFDQKFTYHVVKMSDGKFIHFNDLIAETSIEIKALK